MAPGNARDVEASPSAADAPRAAPPAPGLVRRAWTFLRTRVLTLDVFHAAHMTITCLMVVFGLGFRVVDNWPHSDTDALVAAITPGTTVTIVVPTAVVAKSPFAHPMITVPTEIPRATQLRLRRAISVARLAAAEGAHARTGAPVDIVIVGADATEAGAWLAAEYGGTARPFSTFGAPVQIRASALDANATAKADDSRREEERHFCERDVDVLIPTVADVDVNVWPHGDDDDDAIAGSPSTTTLHLRLRMSSSGVSRGRRGCSSDRACVRLAAQMIAHRDHTDELGGGGSKWEESDDDDTYAVALRKGLKTKRFANDAKSSIVVTVSSWYHLNTARVRYPRWLRLGADMYHHRKNMAMLGQIVGGRDPCAFSGAEDACVSTGWAAPPNPEHEHRTVEMAPRDNWRAPSVRGKLMAPLFFVEADRDEFEVYAPSVWVHAVSVGPPPPTTTAPKDEEEGQKEASNSTRRRGLTEDTTGAKAAPSLECRLRPPEAPLRLHVNVMAEPVPGWVIDAAHTVAVTWAHWAEAAWQTAATTWCMRVPPFVLSTLVASGNA